MAVKMKRSALQGKVPTTTQLELGELAVNTYDGRLFLKRDDGTEAVVEIVNSGRLISAGTGLTGGGSLAANRTLSANIASQAEAEAGAVADKLMTPQRVAQAIGALASAGDIGYGQTWQNVRGSRIAGTTYQNTTGKPIQWAVHGSSGQQAQVSSDGITWVIVANLGAPGAFETAATPVIPNNHYYRTTGHFFTWSELR